MTDCNGNLSVVGSSDNLGDRTDDVRFINAPDNLLLKFLRYKITTVCVNALGEDIMKRLFAAKVSAETRVLSTAFFALPEADAFFALWLSAL